LYSPETGTGADPSAAAAEVVSPIRFPLVSWTLSLLPSLCVYERVGVASVSAELSVTVKFTVASPSSSEDDPSEPDSPFAVPTEKSASSTEPDSTDSVKVTLSRSTFPSASVSFVVTDSKVGAALSVMDTPENFAAGLDPSVMLSAVPALLV